MRMWDAVKAVAAGVEDDGSFDSPAGPGECEARRAAAFATGAADLALPDDWGDRPRGVVLELGTARGTTTLIAFATGESSLLTASGAGIIGRPSHVHVVVQAKRLVKAAAAHVAQLAPAAAFPSPPPAPPAGMMRFYALTGRGILTAEAEIDVLRNGDHPLSPLLEAADALMVEFLQYGLADIDPGPTRPADLLKALAMVALIAGLTWAAWQIPIPWLRWPLVVIGAFFTIAALIVPYALLRAPRPEAEEGAGEGAG